MRLGCARLDRVAFVSVKFPRGLVERQCRPHQPGPALRRPMSGPFAGMSALGVSREAVPAAAVPHGPPAAVRAAFRPHALVPAALSAVAAMTVAIMFLPMASMLAAAVEAVPARVRAMVSTTALATAVVALSS
ncbi:hypothetical protein [Xanthobacter sediminis]|uniref:hypothetical protein n=1 Tax=Xanthobacter sediminis TaxID=3119926 RepID=UPI00372CBF68